MTRNEAESLQYDHHTLFINEAARQLSQYIIQSTTSSRLSNLSVAVPYFGKEARPGPLALLIQDPSVKTANGNQFDDRLGNEVRFEYHVHVCFLLIHYKL